MACVCVCPLLFYGVLVGWWLIGEGSRCAAAAGAVWVLKEWMDGWTGVTRKCVHTRTDHAVSMRCHAMHAMRESCDRCEFVSRRVMLLQTHPPTHPSIHPHKCAHPAAIAGPSTHTSLRCIDGGAAAAFGLTKLLSPCLPTCFLILLTSSVCLSVCVSGHALHGILFFQASHPSIHPSSVQTDRHTCSPHTASSAQDMLHAVTTYQYGRNKSPYVADSSIHPSILPCTSPGRYVKARQGCK